MSWAQYIKAAQQAGYTRVCLVDRGRERRVLATTDPERDVVTTWSDGGEMINENQELLADWGAKDSFCFFGKKFNIVLRDEEDGRWLAGQAKGGVIVARQYKSLWFVAYGERFSGAPDAFNRSAKIWSALAEAGV